MNSKKVAIATSKTAVDIIYAGGTISALVSEEAYRMGGQEMDLIEELSLRVPSFDKKFSIGNRDIAYLGLSENIEPKSWAHIEAKVQEALDRDSQAILITHGTDSMEQTAKRLYKKFKNILVENGAKIVMTGAKDDISMTKTDAWDNLEFALECASSDLTPGVYVAFHHKLIAAEKVVKKPIDYKRGVTMIYIADDDPEYFVAVQKQKQLDGKVIAEMEKAFNTSQNADQAVEYAVNVVRPNHNKFLEYVARHNLRAVLLTIYHAGTANTDNLKMDVSKLVEKLRKEKGIVFFAATENGEPVDLHAYETSVKMRKAGVVPLYDMPHAVALAKLRLIDSKLKADEIIEEMLTSKVGEIDQTRIIADDLEALIKLYRNR
jgi:L-asparaginase/Glu-tRNA(Gln) amidotransferase subunit D